MDQDYIQDLTKEQKKYLNDFNEEFYGANLDYQDLENNRFHKTEEDKKACTDRNNARNRCAYGIAKAANRVNDVVIRSFNENEHTESIKEVVDSSGKSRSNFNIEDCLIDYIDSKDEETSTEN